MVTLQEATQQLRQAESLVAQITGELKALEAQEQIYRTKLAELGLSPEQVPDALAQLRAEEARLEVQIVELTAQLAGALS